MLLRQDSDVTWLQYIKLLFSVFSFSPLIMLSSIHLKCVFKTRYWLDIYELTSNKRFLYFIQLLFTPVLVNLSDYDHVLVYIPIKKNYKKKEEISSCCACSTADQSNQTP